MLLKKNMFRITMQVFFNHLIKFSFIKPLALLVLTGSSEFPLPFAKFDTLTYQRQSFRFGFPDHM